MSSFSTASTFFSILPYTCPSPAPRSSSKIRSRVQFRRIRWLEHQLYAQSLHRFWTRSLIKYDCFLLKLPLIPLPSPLCFLFSHSRAVSKRVFPSRLQPTRCRHSYFYSLAHFNPSWCLYSPRLSMQSYSHLIFPDQISLLSYPTFF